MKRNHGPVPAHARLIVPRTRLSTIGDRPFRVIVAQAWNSLPTNVTASTSLPSFKRQLQTFLVTKSFPSLYYLFIMKIVHRVQVKRKQIQTEKKDTKIQTHT